MSAVLIPTSSEAEWLAARRNGITASEVAIVMGLSPYSSPYALYHQKLGQLPEQDETDAMRLGTYMERFVADRFADLHPEFSVHGNGMELYAHPDRPWQMATPDRLVQEGPSGTSRHLLAVLECKIDGGSDEWGEDGTDEIPVHYRCQVLWQMDVMGVSTGYVACLLWNRRKVRVYEITLDEAAQADLKLMRDEATDFMARLRSGSEPDVDWRPATASALKHLHPDVEDADAPISTQLAGWYMSACRNHKEWERKKKLYENRIRAAIGSARRAVDPGRNGTVIARRDVYDVKEHVRKASHVDKLVPVKPKEESA